MLDIKFIRENAEAVQAGMDAKNAEVDIASLLKTDERRRELITETEKLRAEQNKGSQEVGKLRGSHPELADELKKYETEDEVSVNVGTDSRVVLMEIIRKTSALKAIKENVRKAEAELGEVSDEFDRLMRLLPNPPASDVKVGKDDSENYTIRTVGEPTSFGFRPKDYMELGESLGIIDVERAGKTSGSRFGFLRGDGALMELALLHYAMNELAGEGFTPVIPPAMINERSMSAMGYMDRGRDEIYRIEDEDLFMIGTSEQVLGPMHMDEVLRQEDLPLRYAGFSPCFRREAGSYGKDVRGILRVHQFDKIEMFSFVLPENSDAEHDRLLAMEERLMQGLGLPYRVLGIVSGDLGDPAARKFDIETWVPSQNTYRETHSTSTCTDWQARRLNVRVKRQDGSLEFCHTLNGTAFAIGRTLLAILENFQEEDGSVRIPAPLVAYMGGRTHIKPEA